MGVAILTPWPVSADCETMKDDVTLRQAAIMDDIKNLFDVHIAWT